MLHMQGSSTLDKYLSALSAVSRAYEQLLQCQLSLKNAKAELFLAGQYPPKATVDMKKAYIDQQTVELRHLQAKAEIDLEVARNDAKFWESVMRYELQDMKNNTETVIYNE